MLLLQPLHRLHRKVAGGDALVGKVPLADAYPLHDPLIRRVDHLFQVCVCQHTGWNVPGYTRNFCGDAASHITPREKCESQKPNVDCMRCPSEETSTAPCWRASFPGSVAPSRPGAEECSAAHKISVSHCANFSRRRSFTLTAVFTGSFLFDVSSDVSPSDPLGLNHDADG